MVALPDQVPFAMPEQHPPASGPGALPTPLFWALVASMAVHAAFVAMPRALPNRGMNADAERGVTTLQVALVPPMEKSADREPDVAVPEVVSPIKLSAQDVPAPPVPADAPAPRTAPAPAASVGIRGAGDVRIDAAPLADRNRMGDVLARQMTEFPIEVDFPAALRERIRARYPPAALAAGREDSVAVWIVVDAEGAASEILVLDGSEEFSEAVVAAVKDAHFVPAQNNLKPIRYPISLEFRFVIGPQSTAGTSAVAP